MIKIVTYATKPEGTFEQLINNKYGVKIDVLGMGKRWNGFLDKTIGYLEYCKKCKPDDIVVCVDGYDTEIINDPSEIEERFKSFNCDIVLSYQPPLNTLHSYIIVKIFGTCTDDITMNAGLYAGYAHKLADMLEASLNYTSSDDQRNLNSACHKFDNFKIDTNNLLFYNGTDAKNKMAIFNGKPATLSMHRCIRAPKEYFKFFIPEIFVIFSILFALNKYIAHGFLGLVFLSLVLSYLL